MSRSRMRRASAMPRSVVMRARSISSPDGDLGLLEGLALGDLERLQRALALDAALVDDAVAGEPGPLDLLLGDDLGLAAGALGAGHLDRLGGQRDLALALGDFERLAAADLELLLLALALDAVALDGELAGDLLALGLLAGLISVISRTRRRAISRFWISSSLTMRVSASDALLGDPRLLGRLGGGDLGLLGLLLAERPLAGELGALDGAADLDLALLLEAGIFALALDLEHAPLGFEILRCGSRSWSAARSGCASCGASRSSRSAW